MSKGRSSSMKASSRKQTVKQIQCNNKSLLWRDKLVRSRLWLIRLQHPNWQHNILRVCVIPLQNRFSQDLSTPRCFFPRTTPLLSNPQNPSWHWSCWGSGTGPAVCAHPTHIPVPWAASPLHQHCCCPWSSGEADGAFSALSVYTRWHAAIRKALQYLFLPSLSLLEFCRAQFASKQSK